MIDSLELFTYRIEEKNTSMAIQAEGGPDPLDLCDDLTRGGDLQNGDGVEKNAKDSSNNNKTDKVIIRRMLTVAAKFQIKFNVILHWEVCAVSQRSRSRNVTAKFERQ